MLPAAQLDALVAHEWVHRFEEDADGQEVYRPLSDDTPPARRPRERLRFQRDGTARVWVGGPDDRATPLHATWSAEGRDVVVRVADGPPSRALYRLVSIASDLLRIRVS